MKFRSLNKGPSKTHFHKGSLIGVYAMNSRIISILGLGLLALFALACGAVEGPTGPAGSSATVDQSAIDALVANTIAQSTANTNGISQVTINSVDVNTTSNKTTVSFTLKDSKGVAITSGVSASSIRFALAQLIPGSNGNSDHWQSYISRTKTSTTYDTVLQGTTETATVGTLTYNGSTAGLWTYEFSINIQSITSPIQVTYNPSATHRVAMQVSGLTSNPIYDFRPDGGTVALTKTIVDEEDCNKCHDQLALHGGGRVAVKYCQTCHNPGTQGSSKGNDHVVELDFQSMIHKIHSGRKLPSNVAGATGTGAGNYTIVGYGDSIHSYDTVGFPRITGVQDCTNCHINNVKTPDYAIYKSKPTIQSCGSCHDTVNFVTGIGHGSGNLIRTNDQCASCHNETDIETNHVTAARKSVVAGEYYKVNLISSGNTAPGQYPWVKYSITNPKDSSFYDAVNFADSKVNIKFATSTTGGDWDNDGKSFQSTASMSSQAGVAQGDGTYIVTFSDNIPSNAKGSGVIFSDGHPYYTFPGDPSHTTGYVKSEVMAFKITDTTAMARRDIVDDAKCLNCHGTVALHGGNRINNVQVCITCHNPGMADTKYRFNTSDNTISVKTDGKIGEAVDLKSLIHGIHSSKVRKTPYTVYRNSSEYLYDPEEVTYPGTIQNCDTCHKTGTYAFPLNSKLVGSSTIDPGNSGFSSNVTTVRWAKNDISTHTKTSPAASVCAGCHDSTLSKAHMTQNGASFMTTAAELSAGNVIESCELCHAAGKTADVKVVHGLK